MQIELIMDVKLGILILLKMAPLQKLVLAPGAIIEEIRYSIFGFIRVWQTSKLAGTDRLSDAM